jgi:hypothetical protein
MSQPNLPDLTVAQIDALEDFTKSLQSPLFRRPANKAALTDKYKNLIESISFGAFWQGMASANIPQERPPGFEDWKTWDQIEWIRQVGMSVAWSLIKQLRDAKKATPGEE